MRRVFIDTSHYIGVLVSRDDLHTQATRIARSLVDATFVTTDAVLVELLASAAKGGSDARARAVEFVEAILDDDRTTIVSQSPELFRRGLTLYAGRPDKGYSLTDCMSMLVCLDLGINEVLTFDHHFEQEGFHALLRDDA